MDFIDSCYMLIAHTSIFENEALFTLVYDSNHANEVKSLHRDIIALTGHLLIDSGLVDPNKTLGEIGYCAALEKVKSSTLREIPIAPHHYALNAFDTAYRLGYSDKMLYSLYSLIQGTRRLFDYSRTYTETELFTRSIELYPDDMRIHSLLLDPDVLKRVS